MAVSNAAAPNRAWHFESLHPRQGVQEPLPNWRISNSLCTGVPFRLVNRLQANSRRADVVVEFF